MARRRRQQRLSEDNQDRWLVSYADFITLLFAFFVVMYSVSSVNEGKYRILSETLSEAFGEAEGEEVGPAPPAQFGDPVRDIVTLPDSLPIKQGEVDPISQEMAEQARKAMIKAASQQRVFDELEISLQEYLDRKQINLKKEGDRIEININSEMLFSSGQARLSKGALQALKVVSLSLVPIPNAVQVEGHTDDIPISNFLYPSNWELSAARAASVVHFLSAQGVEPKRLAAVGMGEYRPIQENTTAEGRNANRRVTLLILGAEPEIFGPDQMVPWAEGPAVDLP